MSSEGKPESRSGIEQSIERRLRELGLYAGPADGQWREAAQEAFRLWKAAHGFPQTPHPTVPACAELLPDFSYDGSLWFRELDRDDYEQQLPWLKRLAEAMLESNGGAERVAAEWLLQHGVRAALLVGEMAGQVEYGEQIGALTRLLEDVARRLLLGENFTDRADEDARRAAFGQTIIEAETDGEESGLRPLLPLAARAMLSLAADHPFRNAAAARQALLRFLEGEVGDVKLERLALRDLLRHGLLEEGERRENTKRRLRKLEPDSEVESTREESGIRERRAEIDQAVSGTGLSSQQVDLLESTVRAGRFDEFTRQSQLVKLAQERLGLGEAEAARTMLSGCLKSLHSMAVVNTSQASRDEVMGSYASAYGSLALALARLDRPRELFEVLESHRALEVRLRAQLRRRQRAGELGALAVADRVRSLRLGLREPDVVEFAAPPADPLGREIHPFDRGREQLRLAISREGGTALSCRGWDELAAALGPGEVVLALSCTGGGTSGVAVRRESSLGNGKADAIRAESIDWPDMTAGHITMYEETGPTFRGWPMGLAVVGDFDFRGAITGFVDEICGEIDARLSRLIGKSCRRVYFLPDSLWWLMPLWSLDSLRKKELVVCLSCETLVRRERRRAIKRALIVGDPWGDLPLARLESTLVARSLRSKGIEATVFRGTEATKSRLLSAMPRCGIVHFAGHGIARLREALDSSLPLAMRSPADTDSQVEHLRLSMAVGHPSGWSDFAGQERRFKLLNRWPVELRYSDCGSEVEGVARLSGQRTVGIMADSEGAYFAELLTAAELSSSGIDLSDCGLVFLSACTSGTPRFDDGFSIGGLVGALVEAGVQAVVSCMWPIEDGFACLYGSLFCARVAQYLDGNRVPIASIVAQLAGELRSMPLQGALEQLSGVASVCPRGERADLADYREVLKSRGERPFADPIDWAAFFVSGAPVVHFG